MLEVRDVSKRYGALIAVSHVSFTVGPGVGNGTRSASFPVYGRVAPQQLVQTGAYSDTIVVTVTF